MTCSASLLAKVAQLRDPSKDAISRLLGDRYADRFTDAFHDVLIEG
jgi:ATP-dependent DNA helicase RecQ